jgi:hypothetical protein
MLAIIASTESHAFSLKRSRPPAVACAASQRSRQRWYWRSGMCSDDHSTFTPPFSSILKSVRLAHGLNALPDP